MCGIAGKLTREGAVDRVLLDRMCEVIEHRGPDSRGAFVEDGVGLGVQRLAIIDLQTGDQPIFNEDESVVVVLNGEIYNYRELRDGLERGGHRFGTNTDTEVIVHLYEEHGDDCVHKLRGMFAFALWDRRRRRLLLARDRVGKKPLFYAQRGDTLWFGSEPKSILQDPAVPRDVDYDAVDAFLHFMYVPDPLSAFASIRKLPAAHTLAWEGGRAEIKRYWRLSYADKLELPDAELHEAIREGLLEATRLRLRSDVPLGAFLSGGVDSSAVVAAMVRESSERVRTFSIGFDVESFDETAHARRVAELFDTEHHEFRVEPRAMEILPRLIWHYGEPFADQSAIPSFYLAELTRRHVTVALNGDGGDEDFAGYRRYLANRVAAALDWMPRGAAGRAAALFARAGARERQDSVRARFQRLFETLTMEPWERYAFYMAYFPESERPALYTPEFRARLGHDRSALRVIRDPWRSSDARHVIDRLMSVDVETYLPGDLLVKMDIATMAHSLEVRSPLLDHEFMELAARIPATKKLSGRVAKKVFKDALRPWLPSDILDRRKMGFGVPLAAWFRGALRDLPADVLLDPRATGRGIFDEAHVRGLIDAHRSGSEDNANKLWALLQVELWMQTYVDAPKPQPTTLDVA